MDNLSDQRVIDEMLEGEKREFCEQAFDEIFAEDELAFVVEVRSCPFFVFLEGRFLQEC